MSNDALSLSIRVNINNISRNEKITDYPYTIKIIEKSSESGDKLLKNFDFRTDALGVSEEVIDVPPGKHIFGEANYRGITYQSPPFQVKEELRNYPLDILVYDITDKNDLIRISDTTMMVSPLDAGTLQISEILRIENRGNLTYVGKFNDELDVNQVLYIPVPQGYRFQYIDGIKSDRVSTFNRGIVTQEEIIPGITEVRIGYVVRSDTGVFDLSLFTEKDSPQAENMTILFQDKEDWKVKISHLKQAGSRNFYGKKYKLWKGNSRSVIPIEIIGPTYTNTFFIWGSALFTAFVVSAGILYFGKKGFVRWQLTREKMRIQELIARLRTEADKEDLRGYYSPFKETLENRMKEIDQGLKSS
jgi:hypothetical protein